MLGWSCYEAVAGSVVVSMVDGLVARDLGWLGSYLVPWWMVLTPVHCSVGCCWDKGQFQCTQLGSR